MNSSKMTPEERGSLPPRPPGHSAGPLPASAPKRRFVKLGRKPSDDGSVKSGSSGCSTKSAEGVGVVLRQPSRSRIRRHTNRLSGVFQRGPASSLAQPMALTSVTSSSSFPAYTRKDSLTPGDPTDDPSELSNQITAPGILKIFGSEICEGANYKSVLATTHSSAKELVKEALDRYGLNKEEAESYVLCDAIGHVGGHQWRTECFRVVCDNEKPLLLQALWKPREGLARRFEIQRRSAVEEKRSREKDTITAGINAQARKLQKSRSRVNSTLSERTSCRAQSLWRSLSEVDLTDQAGGYARKDSRENLDHEEEEPERNYEENQEENADRHPKQRRKENLKQNPSVLFEVDGGSERLENGEMQRAMTGREESGREQEGGEREEREERESSDDNVTQFSFHPPHHCPYLLLLQGHSLKQDFVINLLSGSSTVIGRRREDGERSSTDLLLSAPDILPRHCCLRRYSNRRSTRLHLFDGAVVTRNGMVVSKGAELASGDVIGLGQHYMFLFKDPTALAVMHKDPVAASSVERPLTSAPQLSSHATAPPPPPSPPTGVTLLCSTCTSALTGPQTSRGPRRATPYLKDASGRDLILPYHAEYEQRIVREIVAAGSGGKDRPPLTVAFLLCACVQHAATRLLSSDLRRLLLLIAGQVQSAMWEHTKELAANQPEVDTQELPALAVPELLSGLRPLVVWMSNALELLQFIQHQLPHLLAWRSHPDQGEGPEGDREVQDEASMALLEMRLSCVRSASEETMTVLEEVIMLTFQQCVYYITKALYPLLPGLLDSHPSRGSSEPKLPGRGGPFLGSGGPLVPGETEQVLEVLTETRQLLQSCQVHRDLCSQLLAYLFYFINASLLNTLMERGSEAGFYQWARGVSIRVNLDLLLDWAHRSGLGELVLEHTHTLSSAVNLLATPTQNLVQASWTSLRSEFSALSPAQMHHLLRGYTPPPPCPDRWAPTPQEQRAALNTADILESFDSHPPLALPDGGFRLDLSRAVKDPALVEQLDWLRRVVSSLPGSPSPGNTAGEASLQYSTAVPLEAKITKMAALPKASLESLETPPAEVVLPPELLLLQGPCPPSPPLTRGPTSCGLGSCGDLLAQKLQSLELQSREAGGCGDDGLRRSALDPSCLLTPPNTPHNLELVDPETEHLNRDVRGGFQPPLTRTSSLDQHGHADVLEEGCLSADRTGNGIILGENEEEEEGDEGEVFILELQRGARGLGLALVDARDSQLRASGIFIRAVIPDSPAARSQKLGPGDRILAVNGVSLVGLDYQSGHELIRSSGERPRLLVARSDWTSKTIQTQ